MQLELELKQEKINREFHKYHNQNPEVWEKFKQKTLQAIKRGFKHYGAKGIFELIRWETKGDLKSDGFKINNLYTPYYARLFEKKYPEHTGFFRMRKTKKTI